MQQPLTKHHCSNASRPYAFLILALVLTACGAPRMDRVSGQSIDLSGQWLLDRRDSDDVRARLQPLLAKLEAKWRKVERRMEDRPEGEMIFVEPSAQPAGQSGERPGEGAADNSTLHWLRDQRQRETQVLIAFVSPATQLSIQQSPREIRFSSDKGEGSRVLTPGEQSSLFVTMGGFVVNSGWQGASFIVDSRGSGDNPINTVERFTLFEQGEQLEVRFEARLPNLGKQAFRFVYKRKHP